MTSRIVPSGRALVALALLAPLAVLVGATAPGAWPLVPLAALALLGVAVLDGALAPALRELRTDVARDGEVGQPLPIMARAEFARPPAKPPQAVLGFDPRLGLGGTASAELASAAGGEIWTGALPIVPLRRGTGELHDLWLRWSGRLGLGHRQARLGLDREVRVWPDLSPVRSPALQILLRDAQLGLVARRIRGEGTQFEALVEYQPGMDRRRVDWKASARHTRLHARENEAERDNQIVFVLDCGQSMCEDLDGLPRIDRAVSAALTAAYVAIKGGDRVALYGFAERPLLQTPFTTDANAFHRLQSAAAALDYSTREPNFTLALAALTARLRRRSLVILFSEFADPTSAELMVESIGRLVRHHLVIFVTMEDAELARQAADEPENIAKLATAVAADSLARQRKLVLQRLRHLGVDVIDAPWQSVGNRLIDRYLETKRAEAIG